MTPKELEKAIGDLDLAPSAFARRIRVSPRTIDRYLDGTRKIPGPVITNVELLKERKHLFTILGEIE